MILDHPMILRLGCALMHFIWQGTLIAGVLAVLLATLRRRSLLSRIRRVLGRPHEESHACYGWSGAWVSVLLALTVTYVVTERIAAEGAAVQTLQRNLERETVETTEEALAQSIQRNGLELALAIEDQAASPQRSEQEHNGSSKEDPRRLLRLTFRNVGDTPIALNTFLLVTHLSFEISGPDGKEIAERWRPVTGWAEWTGELPYPRSLLPGQTWETTCPLLSALRLDRLFLAPARYRLRAVYRSEPDPFKPPGRTDSDGINQKLPGVLRGRFVGPEANESRVLDHSIEQGNIPPEVRRAIWPEMDMTQRAPVYPSNLPDWSQQGCWEGTIRSNPARFSLTEDELSVLKAPWSAGHPSHAPSSSTNPVADEPDDIVAQWSDLKVTQTAKPPKAQGGEITFESQAPVFLHVKAVQKEGPDAPIKSVLDVWSDKPSTKYDFEVKSWEADQPGNGFVYGDNRVYRKVSFKYLRYDREVVVEPGTKHTRIHDTGAGYQINPWIPSETGNHRKRVAWTSRTMRLRIGHPAVLYELTDPQSPDNIFFRLTICLSQSRPAAALTGAVADDAGNVPNDAPDKDAQSAVSAATMTAAGREEVSSRTSTELGLALSKGQSKSVTVTLRQTAREIVDLCKPARPYADDDPWLAYAAAGGGSYLLLFAAEGAAEEMRGTPDPRHDTLYAVVRYPGDSQSDGRFLLPESIRERTCGDFVTLKVPVSPDRVRVATVVSGMNATDVMQLFQPALDHAEGDHAIILDAIDRDARYLLILSGQGDGDTLSEVVYWSGKDAEPVFLLPRSKRGVRVPDEYRANYEKKVWNNSQFSEAAVTARPIAWGEPKDGLRLGLAPETIHLAPGDEHFTVDVWFENRGYAPLQVPLDSWGKMLVAAMPWKNSPPPDKLFYLADTGALKKCLRQRDLQPGERLRLPCVVQLTNHMVAVKVDQFDVSPVGDPVPERPFRLCAGLLSAHESPST